MKESAGKGIISGMGNNLLANTPLIAAVISCVIAQLLKPVFAVLAGHKFSYHQLLTTGGMPSSHTSAVIALTSSIGAIYGIENVAFAISFVFSIIVMHDAMGIRLEAGKQAKVINEWSEILSKMHKDGPFEPTNLKTLLGHSFAQVLAGAFLGLVIGLSSAAFAVR